MTELDVVVIGAGVIGLAIAREFALNGHEVVILESESKIGQGVSSRSSEVIHAGIYYPPGSLKAELCSKGKDLLYKFCAKNDVQFKRTGKWVVATETCQLDVLTQLKEQAAECGTDDLEIRDAAHVRRLEPALQCEGALFSPSTGIFDSHQFMKALKTEAEELGAVIVNRHLFQRAEVGNEKIQTWFTGPDGLENTARCRLLINAAGLGAQEAAQNMLGFPKERIPKRYLAKGSYFQLNGKSPFRHLVYPVPQLGALGIHTRLDLEGGTLFGPDYEPVEALKYDVDPARAEHFYTSIRKYYPSLMNGQLSPAYSGIRPKIHAPGTPSPDFRIEGPKHHKIGGVIQLFGIESPGLTASLAIATYVRTLDQN